MGKDKIYNLGLLYDFYGTYKIWFFVAFCLFLLVVGFQSGQMNGYIFGINAMLIRDGSNMCDFMNKERDEDGYCILGDNDGSYEYDLKLKCGWEKFRMVGEKKMNLLLTIATKLQIWIFYPVFRCV